MVLPIIWTIKITNGYHFYNYKALCHLLIILIVLLMIIIMPYGFSFISINTSGVFVEAFHKNGKFLFKIWLVSGFCYTGLFHEYLSPEKMLYDNLLRDRIAAICLNSFIKKAPPLLGNAGHDMLNYWILRTNKWIFQFYHLQFVKHCLFKMIAILTPCLILTHNI